MWEDPNTASHPFFEEACGFFLQASSFCLPEGLNWNFPLSTNVEFLVFLLLSVTIHIVSRPDIRSELMV
jgi:hypothetical protein